MKYWSGKKIEKLAENEIFVYGANPEGINGAGAAKAAMSLSKGAKNGIGRGFNGSNAYALVTKSLNAGFLEKSTGILYDKEGYCSVSPEQIRANIDELYEIAKSPEHKDKKFLISYQYETWPNGTPKKSLNGYTSQEMFDMFTHTEIPSNIVFHESYKPHLEKLYKKVATIAEKSEVKEIAFTKVDLPYGWMGNMSAFPIVYNNQEYKTTEALFQALRFTDFPEVQEKIIEQKSPMAAKMIAKQHKHLLKEVGYELMGEKDIANMRLCVKLKMEQYPNLAQELIDTKDLMIIEDCSNRPQESGLFWGAAYQNGAWVGKNILGHILMDYRKELVFKLNEKETNMDKNSDVAQEKQYTFFFHLTSPFSNFHPSRFSYKDYTFISNEQFMMFSKAKTFKDEEVANRIIKIYDEFMISPGVFKNEKDKLCYQLASSFQKGEITSDKILENKDYIDAWNTIHKKIKQLGREVKNYDDTIWNQKRSKVVLFGAREKFTQNPHLKEFLMATGTTTMVEASPYDKIWGIGLSAADAKKMAPEKWPGLNLLGKVLDTLKLEFQNNLTKKLKM